MFRYRWSQARKVITEHFPDGQDALERYLDRPTVKRWRVPTASLGIKTKRSPYHQKLDEERREFERFVATMDRQNIKDTPT
jgi:hypothetical protein